MNPTYHTAFQLMNTAEANGWEILPSTAPGMERGKVWGFRKGDITIKVQEDRRGGIVWASIGDVGAIRPTAWRRRNDCGKLATVLGWLNSE